MNQILFAEKDLEKSIVVCTFKPMHKGYRCNQTGHFVPTGSTKKYKYAFLKQHDSAVVVKPPSSSIRSGNKKKINDDLYSRFGI